jgi:hypothetical protein
MMLTRRATSDPDEGGQAAVIVERIGYVQSLAASIMQAVDGTHGSLEDRRRDGATGDRCLTRE